MKLSSIELAHKILLEEKRPLSSSEIWQIALRKGYDKDLRASGKTPWASLGAQLYIDVRDNKNSLIATIGSRPKLFIIKNNIDFVTNEYIEPEVKKDSIFLEKDLHPLLAHFGFYQLNAYIKTISHHKSSKRDFGEWLHPDSVGCYYPYLEWKPEVAEINSLMGNSALRIYSFEIKRELSFSNIRESFFQAVSNSSWAHEGYLVASKIDLELDFRKELERLSSSFGIGVIILDIEDPDASRTIFPAKVKSELDWETINKLAEMNTDFSQFISRIRTDVKSREPRKEWFDRIDREELIKIFK